MEAVPAYDLNPIPYGKNTLSLNVSETDNTASIDVALSVAEYFQLSIKEAKDIITKVSSSVTDWKNVALSLNIDNKETGLMENAFRL
jgi:serine/threonine-protein kinase HipA